jgi:hypothetical protein
MDRAYLLIRDEPRTFAFGAERMGKRQEPLEKHLITKKLIYENLPVPFGDC